MKIRLFFYNMILTLILPAVLFFCTRDQDSGVASQSKADKLSVNQDPLPSWNEGAVKTAIISYVEDVTNPQSVNFIVEPDRIATFDNDGTLWSEQPAYFQLFFAMDRIRAMSGSHPEWNEQQPFKAVLENNMEALMKQGEKGLLEIIMITHAGMTVEEFESVVMDWIATARHPVKDKPYTSLVYQPMLELLEYLHAKKFRTFIVSGGGIDFMRPWVEDVYGIPRDRVVGSSGKVKYNYNNGSPVIKKLPELDFIDDKEGKPEGIYKYIGRKPVFAAGNSDGDLQMLRWADSNELKSFKLYVHHTDSEREWAYDRDSHIGRLDQGLDEANDKGWTIIDMSTDWNRIYP